jgi:UDP-MurNAc hydroxylase
MKFALIGQACLAIESGDDRLVIDPWTLGSCYWRSWWHFPPARPDLLNVSLPWVMYLTHEHPDHLHFPSLKAFSNTTRVLVPRFPVDRMAPLLRGRGFTRVEEMPHGASVRIGSLRVFSYQSGLDDSIAVVTDGKTTLLNMNDAKAAGLALRQIRRRHPRVDVFLRSHAPAQAYPFCYSAEDERDLGHLSRRHYMELFAAAAGVIRPRWAVPFASNICHLHPESRDQNAYLISPDDVVDACRGGLKDTQVVAMSPGDSWSSEGGFHLSPRPTPGEREQALARLAAEKAAKIAQAMQEELEEGPVDFGEFRDYVGEFLRAVPWPLRRAFPARVAFEMPQSYFYVDLGAARVEERPTIPESAHSVVRANAHLIRNAIARRSLNMVAISRRIRVHLRRDGATCDAAFWALLTVSELGYLPIGRVLLSLRALWSLTLRWRELVAYVPAFLLPNQTLDLIIQAKIPKE